MMFFSHHHLPASRQLFIAVVLGLLVGGVLMVVDPMLAFLGALAVIAFGFFLQSPFLGLLVVVFALPFERIGAYESPVGTIRVSQVVGLATIAAFLFRVLLDRVRSFRPNPTLLLLLAFLAVNVVGLVVAPNLRESLGVLLLTAFTLGFSLLIPQFITTRERLVTVIKVLLVSATLVSLFGLFQFFGDLVGLPTSLTGLRDLYAKGVLGFPRIQSTALEPLYFANFLLLPLGLLYAHFLAHSTFLPRWLSYVLLGLLSVNLVLTVSRGGYFAFAVMLVTITLLSLRSVFRLRVILPLLFGALFVTLIVSRALSAGDAGGLNLGTFSEHVQGVFFGASFDERVETFEQARSAFWSSPWVGIGPGSFGPSVATHWLLEPESGWRIVNNEPLELLAETGVLGFLSILALVIVLTVRSLKALGRAHGSGVHTTLVGVVGASVGILVQYQTFSILYIMHVWFLVGLLVAVQNLLLNGERHEH